MVIRTLGCLGLFALEILAQGGGTITVVDLSGDPVADAEIQATNGENKAVLQGKDFSCGRVHVPAVAGRNVRTFERDAWIHPVCARER